MKTTELSAELAEERLDDEIATLAAHINAATARWLERVSEFRRKGGATVDGCERWLAFRCGITTREAREYVRVAEALEELPLIREAFGRGELTLTKVRALTRVATPRSEHALLDLASSLTASQLERALRVYRRVTSEEARETHELEYLDYYWAEDGSLILRARLAVDDGTLLVRALEAARERVRERRREERAAETPSEMAIEEAAQVFELPRSRQVEALVELAQHALASPEADRSRERAQLVVHVDAATLTTDGPGRSELEEGPVIASETVRRLGCDAERVTSIELSGVLLSVGRKRRTVPPKLRRMLEVRDEGCCRWPGCENTRYLDAHHREHWAHGGETSLDNLVLLCWHHHRLVHEGGYTIENALNGELRFRNRHGLLCPSIPRSPPASAAKLIATNRELGLLITPQTNRNGCGDSLDLALAVAAIEDAVG